MAYYKDNANEHDNTSQTTPNTLDFPQDRRPLLRATITLRPFHNHVTHSGVRPRQGGRALQDSHQCASDEFQPCRRPTGPQTSRARPPELAPRQDQLTCRNSGISSGQSGRPCGSGPVWGSQNQAMQQLGW